RPAARRGVLARHGPGPRPRCLHHRRPPYRVVFSWGIPGSDTLPPGSSTVEVGLTPDGDDTMVVLTHRGLPSTHIGDHRAGWEHQLGRLPAAAGRPRCS
ncbi:MAG TPA: SRPBCC domain-containing protein, partial [Acidimicrobiia bacterium]